MPLNNCSDKTEISIFITTDIFNNSINYISEILTDVSN